MYFYIGYYAGNQHIIDLVSEIPVARKPYPLAYLAREEQKKEIESMEQDGIIRKSNSCYASPVSTQERLEN